MSTIRIEAYYNKPFFTSDQHFGCENALRYRHRPFGDVKEMNQALVKAWNDVVGEDDWVIHLGDIAVTDEALVEYLPQLNGRITLVPGNHDVVRGKHVWADDVVAPKAADERRGGPYFERMMMRCCNGVELVDWRIGPVRDNFFLCHYPIQRHPTLPTVCGHVHDLWKVARNMVNVSCDVWHFRPVPWTTIEETFDAMFSGRFDANVFPDAPLGWQMYVSGLQSRSNVEPTMEILRERALREEH